MIPRALATYAQAQEALKNYSGHRAKFDKVDIEIARILRRVAKGEMIISVHDTIRSGGVDEQGRPHLAIMRADQEEAQCWAINSQTVTFSNMHSSRASEWHFEISWPDRPKTANSRCTALLPRIPPRLRPEANELMKYHILWEADWTDTPHDPLLLKRIGKDAWVVVAAWDLTPLEVHSIRMHQPR